MDSHGKYEMREFGYSETFIREGNRGILIFGLFLVPFLVIFALYVSNFRIEKALIPLGFTLLIFGIIIAIEIPLINRRLRKLRILIDEDKLVKQCGKKQQIFLWKDIARIKTVENKNGVVAQIKIYPKKPKMAMYLHGFREMENLANLIKERTSDSVVHLEKRWKLDWHNPFVGLLLGGVPTVVIMFIVASMGSKAGDIFAIVCALLVGLWILMFRPLTKLNASSKWVELVFGIVLLGIGIYALIYFLFVGKFP
ncbi:MAG: hypothetical protein A2Z38_08440 [Planctomycetes bacterium RBG_19FT_COMBO_48_8]|nr:MAG: hypothetical protein A2Z38_08440 [Planctomycetes bacterium RBG_19FT_COMBO_48_8]